MTEPRAVASRLMREHETGARFRPLGAEDAVTGSTGAYAVQRHHVDLLRERSGEPVGYKIGLTSARMQQMCGIDSPVAGVVLAGRVHRNGTTVSIGDYGRLGIEFEIGVRIGSDLGRTAAAHTAESVAGAVSGICAAVELIDDRHADYGHLDALSLIADNSWNAGIVLDDWRERWPALPELRGRVLVDGVEVDSGLGRDVMGHPFAPLAWLANHLGADGGGLKAGDVVLTGSLVVTRFPEQAGLYRYDLEGVGSVDVTVTA